MTPVFQTGSVSSLSHEALELRSGRQAGKAPLLQSGYRGFESFPDHLEMPVKL